MNDIKVGCARWYGVLYPSRSVPQGDYEKNNIIYNVPRCSNSKGKSEKYNSY